MPLMRGARKSPRHKLLGAMPHRVVKAPPPQFATVPKKLSYWLNNEEGDCVTAEEAYAKACWSVFCGLDELFIPDSEVGRWADAHGFANGADLAEVMDAMRHDGFRVDGKTFTDGPYQGVDYSNEPILQSAIATGPVKIAIDANALPSGAGNESGWYATGGGRYNNTDHCVGLSGYGPAGWLYQQLGVSLPSNLPADTKGYLLFTWNTIGFVTHQWLMGTCTEAWVRSPTTPGQGPTPPPEPPPTPPPTPPPPPPVPPLTWWQRLIAWLESLLFHHQHKTGQPCRPKGNFGSGEQFGLTKEATLQSVNWGAIIAWIKAELALYGPEIIPVLQAWVNGLPVGPIVKQALMFLIALLAAHIPTPPPAADAPEA